MEEDVVLSPVRCIGLLLLLLLLLLLTPGSIWSRHIGCLIATLARSLRSRSQGCTVFAWSFDSEGSVKTPLLRDCAHVIGIEMNSGKLADGREYAFEWLDGSDLIEKLDLIKRNMRYGETLEDLAEEGYRLPRETDFDVSWGFFQTVKLYVAKIYSDALRILETDKDVLGLGAALDEDGADDAHAT